MSTNASQTSTGANGNESSRTEHTPGPWHRNIKPASRYPTIFAGRSTHIATLSTQGLTDEEIEANCNLITAAPDLLESLQEITSLYIKCLANKGYDYESIKSGKVGKAQAAIAKATGR